MAAARRQKTHDEQAHSGNSEETMPGAETIIDGLIENQRHAIRWYAIFALIVFSLGLLILLFAILSTGSLTEGSMKTILGIAGGFVSTISGFPLKELIARREKIGIFESLKMQLKMPNASEQSRIQELIWEVIHKTALA